MDYHWTERSFEYFQYSIASSFLEQVNQKIETDYIDLAVLAQKLGVSKKRVSQVFNHPEKLTLNMAVRLARALGLKVSLVLYDDEDQTNKRGPINSEIFQICWSRCDKPKDFFAFEDSPKET
jgi:predicted XRE-type DNA-binding protein